MKRLWIALILLAAILAGTLLHARALRSFTGEVTGLLDLAQAAAGAGRWTDAAALTIDPAPDTLIRVHMAWKALEHPVEVEPQALTAPARTGFTAVEWGGTQVP